MTRVPPADPQELRAAADRILELHEAGEVEAAREVCDAVERRADRDQLDDPVVRESVFTARFERGVLAAEAGDLAAATAGYLAAAALPVDEDDPDQTHELAMALLNAGICWGALGDDAAALATYDDLLARVGDATDPVTADQVVRARVNRAVALLRLDRGEESVAAADALAAPDAAVALDQRAMVLRVRAAALHALGRTDDAVETLDEVARLRTADDPAVRAQAVAAEADRLELRAPRRGV